MVVDIGGQRGNIFPETVTLPRGIGIEQSVTFPVNGFCGSTFIPNGGVVKLLSNKSLEIYDISYVISRTHRSITHNGTNPI